MASISVCKEISFSRETVYNENNSKSKTASSEGGNVISFTAHKEIRCFGKKRYRNTKCVDKLEKEVATSYEYYRIFRKEGNMVH